MTGRALQTSAWTVVCDAAGGILPPEKLAWAAGAAACILAGAKCLVHHERVRLVWALCGHFWHPAVDIHQCGELLYPRKPQAPSDAEIKILMPRGQGQDPSINCL